MKNKVLAVSLTLNAVLLLAYIGADQEIKAVKKNRQKIYNYATVARDLIHSHYQNGHKLHVSPEAEMNLDALMILVNNDIE